MKISFNFLLKTLNTLFLLVSVYFYYYAGGNDYVNSTTIILCLFLAIELHLFLSYANKNNNLLLTILCFDLILYYSARVFTLLYTEYSVVFLRLNPVTFSDVNYTLFFIIISNFFFFFGIYIAANSKRKRKSKPTVIIDPFSEKKVIIFLFISILLGFPDFIDFGPLTGLMSFIKFYFLNPFNTVLLAMIYFVSHSERMKYKSKIIFIILFVLQVLGLVFYSSRAAIPTIMLIVLIATLVKNNNKFFLKFSHLFMTLILILLSFFLFLFTSFIRPMINEGDITNRDKITLLQNYNVLENINPKKALSPIFDRIGFLDYATEIIAHKPNYSNIITPSYYFKSIVDNVFSPGFDLFGTPKVANALSFRYSNKGELSFKNLEASYQSDQLTIYGEFYALFGGWLSIVFFFFTGYFFQSQIQFGDNYSILISNIYKGLVLFVFIRVIDSFGIDWIIQNVLTLFFSYWLFKKYIIKKEITLAIKNKIY